METLAQGVQHLYCNQPGPWENRLSSTGLCKRFNICAPKEEPPYGPLLQLTDSKGLSDELLPVIPLKEQRGNYILKRMKELAKLG